MRQSRVVAGARQTCTHVRAMFDRSLSEHPEVTKVRAGPGFPYSAAVDLDRIRGLDPLAVDTSGRFIS